MDMQNMPIDPLTPPTCDLRAMPFMPLDVTRLLNSDFIAQTDCHAFKAGMTLMATSWQQVPAASLPGDDKSLAWLAHVTLRRWKRIKEQALRGWITCSDGRLYHPLIAEFALDAFDKVRDRLDDTVPSRRISSHAERQRRYRERLKEKAERDAMSQASRVTPDVTPRDVTRDGSDASPVTPPPHTPPHKEKEKEKGGAARDASHVTPVTASPSQRLLPVLQAMPAAAGADAPSPPPDLSDKFQTKAGKLRLTPDEQRLCEATWAKYGAAFQERYDAPPLKDGKASYHIASLVRSLGVQAPEVAAHYVRSNHDWYVKKGHDTATLLGDVQKLRAEWMATQKRAEQVAATQRQSQFIPSASPVRANASVQAALQELTQRFTGPGRRSAAG